MSGIVKSSGAALSGYPGADLVFSYLTDGDISLPDQAGVRMGDIANPSVDYGVPLQRIYGASRLPTTLMWAAPLVETAHTEEVEAGGKGGGTTTYQQTSYTYTDTFAVMISANKIIGVSKIWLNGKLFYENRPYLTGSPKDAADSAANFFTVYTGDESQLADADISAVVGAANNPAYRDRSYIVFSNLELAEYGNKIPMVSVEVIQYGTGSNAGTLKAMPIPLHYIVGDLLTEAGLSHDQYDCTQLTKTIDGFVYSGASDVATTLQQLGTLYGFYSYDNGEKLVFAMEPTPLARTEHDARCMINEDYLIANAYHDVQGRQGYFPASSGTSEGQFLMIIAACKAYVATSDSYWLTLAENMVAATFPMYNQSAPASASGIIYTPHWLFGVRKPEQMQSFILAYKLTMTKNGSIYEGTIETGPGAYGEKVNKVLNLFETNSTFLTWENPYASVVGTEYGEPQSFVTSASGCDIVATAAQLGGATAATFDVYVTYVVEAGPMLGVSEMMEAWPNWRRLESGEIDCAVDTLPWAWSAFDLLFKITSNSQYSDQRTATDETIELVFDVDDGRAWVRKSSGSPFSLPGTYISSDRAGFGEGSLYRDKNRDVSIYCPAASGEVQYGRGITDITKVGDTHIRVVISSENASDVDLFLQDGTDVGTATRYYYTITTTTSLATYDIAMASFSARQLTGSGWTEISTGLPASTTIDVVGIIYGDSAQENITLSQIRPIPEVQLPYTKGVSPYTANSIDGALLDWQGNPGVGYQDPQMWVDLGNSAARTLMVDFIEDSQDEYNTLHSVLGPFIPAYVWDRFDSLQLGGTPGTWTWVWPDPNSEWVGYTARVVAACAKAGWKGGDTRCRDIALNFLNWLNSNWTVIAQFPPTNFPASINGWVATNLQKVGDIIEPTTSNTYVYKCTVAGTTSGSEPSWPTVIGNTVTDGTVTWECSGYVYGSSPVYGNYHEPHAVALWMRAAGYLHANGTSTATMLTIINRCWDYLETRIQTSGDMSGTWSSNPSGNEWFGFWGAEIIATLALFDQPVSATVDDGLDAQRSAAGISSATITTRINNYKTWLSANTRSVTVEAIEDFVLNDEYIIKRKQASELPKEISITYHSPSRDGGTEMRYSRKRGAKGDTKKALRVDAMLASQDAQDLSLRLLNDAWARKIKYTLTGYNLLLTPGDVKEYTKDGNKVVVQHKNITIKNDEMDIEADSYSKDVYTTSAGLSFDTAPAVGLSVTSDTLLVMLDIPLVSDDHNYPGFYATARASTANWIGGGLFVSNDGGVNYSLKASFISKATYGTANAILAANPVSIIDRASTLQVTLEYGTLASVTEIEMLNGANLILIGNELLQFQDAALISPGVYEISNLLRGRRGTEHAIYGHVSGERVILMNGFERDVTMDSIYIGASRKFKAVSTGQSIGDITASDETVDAVRLKPYSPAHLTGVRSTGTGDLDLTWIRRARTSAGWMNNVDVPLDEDIEYYYINFYDALPSSGGNLLFTVNSSVESKTILGTLIDDYYASSTSTVYVGVSQHSAIVGQGFEAEGTF